MAKFVLRRAAGAVAALLVGLALAACGGQGSQPIVPDEPALPPNVKSFSEVSAIACASLRHPVFEAVNPATGQSLLTTNEREARNASKFGYTQFHGAVMKAASISGEVGLTAVHRMSSPKGFAWVDADRVGPMQVHGFKDQGVNFYAASRLTNCTKPVYEFTLDEVRRYTADKNEYESLAQAGWVERGPAFFVAADPLTFGPPSEVGPAVIPDPDPEDSTFTFAAIPDTQREVHDLKDQRFAQRSEWLASARKSLDLRFAVQVGDLVDWDTPDHIQYQAAVGGLAPLATGDVPYFLNIGNHDGQAVCPGGGACDPRFTPALARMTDVFNQYFATPEMLAHVGQFEPGKVDNTYTTVGAGGTKWLLLNLELWPRKEVIAWAGGVIRSNPDYNVIIATHAFLDSNYQIDDKPNYGSTTSRFLFDNLVAVFPNVKMVLCGHAGQGVAKVVNGKTGNKVFILSQAYHSDSNPVRLVAVNVTQQSISTWVTLPATREQLTPMQTFESAGIIK